MLPDALSSDRWVLGSLVATDRIEGDPSTPWFRPPPEPSPIPYSAMFIHVSEQKPAVVLRTERLVLRPFRLEDVDGPSEYTRIDTCCLQGHTV